LLYCCAYLLEYQTSRGQGVDFTLQADSSGSNSSSSYAPMAADTTSTHARPSQLQPNGILPTSRVLQVDGWPFQSQQHNPSSLFRLYGKILACKVSRTCSFMLKSSVSSNGADFFVSCFGFLSSIKAVQVASCASSTAAAALRERCTS
jgi:hypothetical protein